MKKILIANRGEIANRVIRTCKYLGIETVAVYSKADKNALHSRLADKSVCIGEASPRHSYLRIDRIIAVALGLKVDAIHPGVGFLSENYYFAKACEKVGIIFIGPPSQVIKIMGNKHKAREYVEKIGVKAIPVGGGPVSEMEEGKKQALKLGFPVILKAVSGGGGKGIRKVLSEDEFENKFMITTQEASRLYNDDRLLVEKYIIEARHIEVQILAGKNRIIHLGMRNCSIQRNHQKIIEEASDSLLPKKVMNKIQQAAINIAKKINYRNAGTIEFLVGKDDSFFFLEMNTRIQVEHPITESVTGIDIVEQQIQISETDFLKLSQKEVTIKGYAIECRVNAEVPEKNFIASVGEISKLKFPSKEVARIDTGVIEGDFVTSIYDSLLFKVIVHGSDRNEAINKMNVALNGIVIEGIKTNKELLINMLTHKNYWLEMVTINFMNSIL